MKYYKISCKNVIVEAKNEEEARIGFANYMGDIGIECFEVEQVKRKDFEQVDWTA